MTDKSHVKSHRGFAHLSFVPISNSTASVFREQLSSSFSIKSKFQYTYFKLPFIRFLLYICARILGEAEIQESIRIDPPIRDVPGVCL